MLKQRYMEVNHTVICMFVLIMQHLTDLRNSGILPRGFKDYLHHEVVRSLVVVQLQKLCDLVKMLQ